MTSKTTEQTMRTGPLTSQKGRQWLRNFCQQDAVTQDERCTMINIPDVTPVAATAASSHQSLDHESLARILAETVDENPVAEEPSVVEPTAPTTADIAETPEEWTTTKPPQQPQPRQPKAQPGEDDSVTNQKLQNLVNSIVERFPVDAPTVLMFTSVDSNPQTNEVCARVSSLLASLRVGKVLLIDADMDAQDLSKASGLLNEPGFSTMLNEGSPWNDMVYGGGEINLEFMPSGGIPVVGKMATSLLRSSLHDMKRNYQFICVSVGDAHRRSAELWSEVCDGSYLVVSLKNTHEIFAKSAVNQLRENGARLLGCVVADAA